MVPIPDYIKVKCLYLNCWLVENWSFSGEKWIYNIYIFKKCTVLGVHWKITDQASQDTGKNDQSQGGKSRRWKEYQKWCRYRASQAEVSKNLNRNILKKIDNWNMYILGLEYTYFISKKVTGLKNIIIEFNRRVWQWIRYSSRKTWLVNWKTAQWQMSISKHGDYN